MSGHRVISEVPGDGIGWIATPDIAVPQLDGGREIQRPSEQTI
jgi:hypothetical protein